MAASKFIISAMAGDDLEGWLHGPGGEDAEVRGGAGENYEAWGQPGWGRPRGAATVERRPGWGRPRGRQRMRRGRSVMHARPRMRGRGRGRTRGQGRRRWRGRDDEVRVGAGRCRVGAASGQRGGRGRGRRRRWRGRGRDEGGGGASDARRSEEGRSEGRRGRISVFGDRVARLVPAGLISRH